MGNAVRYVITILTMLPLGAALGQTYSRDMRVLIAPNAAIDGATYEKYQQCLSQISLQQDAKKVVVAREACKNDALRSAYRVDQTGAPSQQSEKLMAPSVDQRRQAQQQKLEKFK